MALQARLRQIGEALLDFVFPSRCIGCGAEGEFLCLSCLNSLPRLAPPYCERCGVPFTKGRLCPTCANSPLDIDGIRSLFLHQGVAREAIHWLKYKNLKALAKPLAELMAEYLGANPLPVDILMAVPLHPRRMRQRGYNQSNLLAEELARLMQLPISERSLTRLRNTSPQVSLGAKERRRNVQGAFQYRDQVFMDKGVLLIDDVCTTGATLNACAIALKDAGAASVWGLTLSREC